MLMSKLREAIKDIADDYEVRDDGDIEAIPDSELVDLVVDHKDRRVYLIWSMVNHEE